MSGASAIFDTIVQENATFSDEDMHTSEEQRADDAKVEADQMELDLDNMLQEIQQEPEEEEEEEAEEEEQQEESPLVVKKKTKEASPKKKKKKNKVAVHAVIQAFSQMIEPMARVCVFEKMPRVQELMSGEIEETAMRPEEVAFVETTNIMGSTLESASLRISQHYAPVLRGIQERVANNEPMNRIMTRILNAEYVEAYPLAPPKRKGVSIIDCFTGAIIDGSDSKELKDTTFLFFLRAGEEDPTDPSSFDGYYMSKAAGNLVRMTLMLQQWDSYVCFKLSEAVEQYRATFLKGVTVLSSWGDIYAELTQGFAKKPLKKWKQTKDVVENGSFVHTVIELRRLLEVTL